MRIWFVRTFNIYMNNKIIFILLINNSHAVFQEKKKK